MLFSDVVVEFLSEYNSTMESQGSVKVCIRMEGELEKTITVKVNSTNGIWKMHGQCNYSCMQMPPFKNSGSISW